jgi:hypothetical protein
MTGTPILITVLLLGTPALAVEPASVIVGEALSLPAHLESYHARVRDGVKQVVESGGWQQVAAEQQLCADARCAVQLARTAKAQYVVFVDGKYRTGGYDVRVQLWNGQDIVVEQAACEDCSAPELVTRVQSLLAPLVEAANRKRADAAAVSATPATTMQDVPPLLVTEPTARIVRQNYLGPLAWTAMAVGAAAAAGGAYLVAIDGRYENCSDVQAGRICTRQRVTHAGLPLLIGGAAIAGLGGFLLIYHYRSTSSEMSLRIGPGSAVLGGRF